MGERSNIIAHSAKRASKEMGHWAREHIRQSAISLAVSLFGVPVYLLIRGQTVEALKEQAAVVLAYSAAAPLLVVLAAFSFFFVRAPFRIIAERTAELRGFRQREGMDTSDLDAPRTKPRTITIPPRVMGALIVLSNILATVFIVILVGDFIEMQRVKGEIAKERAEILEDKRLLLENKNKLQVEQKRGVAFDKIEANLLERLGKAEKIHFQILPALRKLCARMPNDSNCGVLKDFDAATQSSHDAASILRNPQTSRGASQDQQHGAPAHH